MVNRDESLTAPRDQTAALHIISRAEKYLERRLPELEQLLTQNPHQTYGEMAIELIKGDDFLASCYCQSPKVVENAVGYIVRKFCSQLINLPSVNTQKNIHAGQKSMELKKAKGEFLSHQQNAGRTAATKLKAAGKWETRQWKMAEARGVTPWSKTEDVRLLELLTDPTFKGDAAHPYSFDAKKIADQLNNEFHHEQLVRNRKSIHNRLRLIRK